MNLICALFGHKWWRAHEESRDDGICFDFYYTCARCHKGKHEVEVYPKNCPKCHGAGWVWWYELDEYHGPANDPHDCYSDDTKYSCDVCSKYR